MCGIIGYIGSKQLVPILIDGLRRLEYRGYDSAGVAVVRNGTIELRRSAGKLARLEEVIATHPLEGEYGIGHTRWATHGRPTEENAHPHRDCTSRIVVVHSVIENYLELKQQLKREGHSFNAETDTEIVAHLVEREMKDDGLENAVEQALLYMRGLFGLVLISADDPNKIVTVRNGPPIVVGLGDGEFFVASDIPAILSHTRDVVFLGDEEMAIVITRRASSSPTTPAARFRRRAPVCRGIPSWPKRRDSSTSCSRRSSNSRSRSGDCPRPRIARRRQSVPAGDRDPRRRAESVERVVVLACGTSGAALVGQVPDRVAGARAGRRRLRFRVPLPRPDRSKNTLAIVITQSGETADTLAALRETKKKGARSIAICNVVGSMATRELKDRLHACGSEIGVASTKAFTSACCAAPPRHIPWADPRYDAGGSETTSRGYSNYRC